MPEPPCNHLIHIGNRHSTSTKLLDSQPRLLVRRGFECALGGGWAWFGTYGDELLQEIKTIPFKSMGPKPKQKRAAKRTVVDVATEESAAKRTPVDGGATPAPALTPVRSRARPLTSTPAIASPSTPVPTYLQYPPQYAFPQRFAPIGHFIDPPSHYS